MYLLNLIPISLSFIVSMYTKYMRTVVIFEQCSPIMVAT